MKPRITLSTLVLGCLLACGTHAQEHAHAPADVSDAPAEGSIAVPIDAATLAALPREPVSATAHGKALRCEGVPLLDLLRKSKAMPADPLRGKQLARLLRVDARDGYRAVFSLAELDPTLGNRKVLLVDRCDGKPLATEDGPLRLIVPDDARPARWVRQVQSMTVTGAP